MAKAIKTKGKSKKKHIEALIIGRKKITFFLIGLITIVIAYILMAQPPVNGFLSRTLAPVLLVIAYLVIIPISLLIKDKPENQGG